MHNTRFRPEEPPAQLALLYEGYRKSKGLCTDTRKLQPGEVFLALRGENFNGNRYARQALQQGAVFAIIDDARLQPPLEAEFPGQVHCVTNTLQCLQHLARRHRRALAPKVVAITGSNGKTTTKALLAHLLKGLFRLQATPGNLNNHIGVPLTLLGMKPGTEVLVVEMGDNQPGDIRELAQIAEPNWGLITNCGQDHLGGYPDILTNWRGKLELFHWLAANGGKTFLNAGDDFLWEAWHTRADAAFCPANRNSSAAESSFPEGLTQGQLLAEEAGQMRIELCLPERPPITLPVALTGRYNLANILAAASIAHALGLTPAQVQQRLMSFRPGQLRSEWLCSERGLQVLLDAYNANPSSMQAVVEGLQTMELPAPRLYILGAMNELGDAVAEHHTSLGHWLTQASPPEEIWLIGEAMQPTADVLRKAGVAYRHFPTTEAAEPVARTTLQDPKWGFILLKGSRSFRLERLQEYLPALHPLQG